MVVKKAKEAKNLDKSVGKIIISRVKKFQKEN